MNGTKPVAGKNKNGKKKDSKKFWPVKAFILTFVLAMVFSMFSETAIGNVPLPIAILLLGFIIAIGILFDVIGIAVATANVAPFAAMAAKRIRGAKQAIELVKNTDKVSNICNDVVGDICGIISGAAGAVISIRIIAAAQTTYDFVISILVSSLIAALTVGGKAAYKSIAINNSSKIVFFTGRFMALFSRK